jgi:ABC-type nitrate/sulfonate/bicarbonate transport system substrate-binding protein
MLAHASFSVLTTVLSASLLALVGCQAPAASAPLAKPAPTATASGSGAAPTAPGAAAAAPAAAAGGALEVIKVGDVRVLNGGGLYVAVEKGYFRDQGLDVRLENLTGGADAVPFLATGELDLALGNVSVGLFNAFDRGADVKIIAPAGILPCRIAPCR